jgi:hypothetical protein
MAKTLFFEPESVDEIPDVAENIRRTALAMFPGYPLMMHKEKTSRTTTIKNYGNGMSNPNDLIPLLSSLLTSMSEMQQEIHTLRAEVEHLRSTVKEERRDQS